MVTFFISITDLTLIIVILLPSLFLGLSILHLHVHEDFNTGFDVLQDLEGTHLHKLIAFFDKLVFVVIINLFI